MPGHDDEVPPNSAPDKKEAGINVSVTYTITAQGQLRTDWEVDASRALPVRLPPNLFK